MYIHSFSFPLAFLLNDSGRAAVFSLASLQPDYFTMTTWAPLHHCTAQHYTTAQHSTAQHSTWRIQTQERPSRAVLLSAEGGAGMGDGAVTFSFHFYFYFFFNFPFSTPGVPIFMLTSLANPHRACLPRLSCISSCACLACLSLWFFCRLTRGRTIA